jgi:uncharacterized damage-inducible protein DinB
MNLSDIQQLFAYTEWANALVLEAAAKLTPEQLHADRQISHRSIWGTLTHMAAAEWVWLERGQGHSPTGAHIFPEWEAACGDTIASLRERWQQVAAKRQAWLAQLSEDDLAEMREFKRLNGEASALKLASQLQHCVNHATLHRGQVVGMIRQLGIVPPATDFLFYLR